MNVATILPYGGEKRTFETPKHRLGTIGQTPDGALYKYCRAGAVALSPGLFTTYISTPTNEQTVTVAHAAGTTVVTVTAAGATADQFKDGYLVVTAGAGAGERYKIKSNTAAASNLVEVTLYDTDGLKTAWSVSTTDVDLFPSPCNLQVVCPTDGQQFAVGLTPVSVAINYYYWSQVTGLGAVMIDNAGGAAGLELDEKIVLQSLNHAGQGFIGGSPDATAILAGYRQILGYLVTEEDTVDNEMELVKLTIGL